MKYPKSKLFEQLADIQHQIWSHWQKYLHSKCDVHIDGRLSIPNHLINQWERQIETPYKDLPEKEKDSDREQVMRYWHLIEK